MSRNRKLNSDSRLSRRSLLQITTAGVLASTLGTAAVSGLSIVDITIPETDVDARIWGNSFRTPTDLIVTAENPRLTDSYTYESFDGQATEEAPTGQQFAFIDLTVKNDAGQSRETPSSFAFDLAANGEQVEPLGVEYERDDDYTGANDVLDGVNASGVLPYQIPAEATIDDLRLFYDDSIILGADVAEWQVTWQSGSIGDRSTFSVTETSVPSQIPQSGTYQVSVTVENVGSVTATETVKYALTDSLGQTLAQKMVSVSVAPENLAVLPFDIDADSINGTGDLIHVFSTDDDATTIETTDNPDINWGVSFRTPTDLIVTAENPRLTDSYTYESFSGQETKRAPEGRQFAFIDLSVSNDAFKTRSTPDSSLFELAAANEQVEPLNLNYERDDDYIGSTNMLSDVTESGVLPYEIPAEASIDDLRLFYDDLTSTGDGLTNWKVTWESIDAPDVEIVGQTLDPPEINADSSRTHTLSFDALNVSTDGGQDDFTVELPDKVELLEVTDVTVTRESADAGSDVEYSFTDNTITFSVNFDASQRVQDMSFDVVMSLTANDTATDG